jgi:hypothetical protein
MKGLSLQEHGNSDVKELDWQLPGSFRVAWVFASLPNILAPPSDPAGAANVFSIFCFKP